MRRCPGVRFVWVMGADNLRSFYRWQNWRGIADLMPMAVVDRMGSSLYATGGRAAQALARYRLPERLAPELAEHDAAGLALSARPEIAPVLDRAPAPLRKDRPASSKVETVTGQRAYLNESWPRRFRGMSRQPEGKDAPVPHRSPAGQSPSCARTRLQAP